MKRRYRTVDVFTTLIFGGNPLAVVLDAQGLSSAQMQAIAAEFNYSETTFVLPPTTPGHDATIRIFTPRAELPFAGHPNVGTAFVLANEKKEPVERLIFDEIAGSVAMTILRAAGRVIGAELTAPQPLRRFGAVDAAAIARALGLGIGDIHCARHPPLVAGVGIPFVFVELATRAALARADPDIAVQRALLPLHGSAELYAYVRTGPATLHARMFAPMIGIAEDPATGSATAAVTALIAETDQTDAITLHVHQGDDMGRPSLMQAAATQGHGQTTARVGGHCVAVMEGWFTLVGK